MNAVPPNLFKGIAVVIDNGIGREPQIDNILENIRIGGGHAIKLSTLPEEQYDLEHFSRVSFFIMDWNLEDDLVDMSLEDGVRLPATLSEDMVARNIRFLKRLSEKRHAPVFIFTNEDTRTVLDELSADGELEAKVRQSHILVMSKGDVKDKLYEVLETWAKETPSVLTLKTWELGHAKAANELFIDLHDHTPYWPVLLWQTFGEDGVPAASEMNRLINRLVESRMGRSTLDLEPFLAAAEGRRKEDENAYRASVFSVLEGERFLRDERLEENVFAPGDVFGFPVQEGQTSYYMNIRPECDCLRGGDDLELYLLQAKIVKDAESHVDQRFGTFTGEKDNEAIVFAMLSGQTYSIKLRDTKVRKVKDIGKAKAKRIGRLLPPFVTRVQQRYAAYVQRPGMPRIPSALYQGSSGGG